MADVMVGGRASGLSGAEVRRIAGVVLAGERRHAALSVSFVGRATMRVLNHEHTGRDSPTDVLAFALTQPGGGVVGDIYVCPAVAREQALELGLAARRELTRLVVHGILHVLGQDHPESGREQSAMWRRQERYLKQLA